MIYQHRSTLKVLIYVVALFVPCVLYAQDGHVQVNFSWGKALLKKDASWYGSDQARRVANTVLLYQTKYGAWPKNTNLSQKPESEAELQRIKTGSEANTIDNNATTRPMKFMAMMYKATGDEAYKNAFNKGLDYLLISQYENGGWPQFYPLRSHGYYSEITFNDNAMMNVMFVLNDIAKKHVPYTFVDEVRRRKSFEAVGKGIDCILKTQVVQNGKPTVWCAQYNQFTLQPAWARNFEPPSLSGSESVDIVRFLMQIDDPSPAVINAIEGAVNWFRTNKITGLKFRRKRGDNGKPDSLVEPDSTAGPLWARFYELGSNKPLFVGRDKVYHYHFNEVEQERRGGYAYYGTWPESLLEEVYPAWKAKHASE